MNARYFFVAIFLSLSCLVFGNNNPAELHLTILQGGEATFTLSNDFQDPTVYFAPSNGIVEEMEDGNSNLFEISYVPDVDFVGSDVFSIQTIHFAGFFPTAEITVVYIDVIKSSITANDDFISVGDEETLEIFPLDNDASSTNSHSLLDISHVMYGEAIATDSNSIIYTVSDQDLDFVNYVIVDSLGTSSSSTIYLKKQETVESYVELDFSISSDQSQIIFLENDDYATASVLMHGSIEYINDRVVRYYPSDNVAAVESILFEDSDGNQVDVEITIFDKYIDIGIVNDDIFFTAVGQSLVFDVFENDYDNSLVMNEASLSEELTYLGSGMIEFSPSASFEGVVDFSYSATNGFTTESGLITIGVNDFVPASAETYDFEVLEGSVLSIPYDIPLENFYFEVASDPTYGTLSYISDGAIVNTSCGEVINTNAVIYTPFDGYEGMDEFDLLYCPDTGVSCELIKTNIDIVANVEEDCNCLTDCVWEGDANNDGQVDILDVLAVGRSIGASGASRILDTSWSGENADDWLETSIYGINSKYADADGNGVVTSADLMSVVDHYGFVHSYTADNTLSVKDYPFSIVPRSTDVEVGETMYLDIYMGNDQYPVRDLQGVAFSLNLNAFVVDSASLKVTYSSEGYFVKQSSFFDVDVKPADGVIHTAAIKTNNSSSNGFGLLATAEFIVEDELDGVKPPQRMRTIDSKMVYDIEVLISNVVISDGRGFQYSISPTESQFEVSIDDDTAASSDEHQIAISPNPTADYLTIDFLHGSETIAIYDLLGNKLSERKVSDASDVTLDIQSYPSGSYLLSIVSEDQTISKKFQVVR